MIARRKPLDQLVHAEVRDLGSSIRTTYLDRELVPDEPGPVARVPFEPGEYGVLHAHFGSNARHYVFARAQAAAPLVVTFHGRDFSADPHHHGRGMYDILFRTADAVTYNARHAREALEALGCAADKLHLVRMPVDTATLAFRGRCRDGEPLRLVTVGRLVEKKGHGIALRALAGARGRLPDTRYDIVGDGPLSGGLRELVAGLGLTDVVRFQGAADSTAVRALLDRAHVFVLASKTAADGDMEGAPLSLLEAQACGLPVVSTRHGGIEEAVADGRSGLLVPEGDVDALADALVRMAAAEDAWPRLGAAGRAHVVERYDVGVCTNAMLQVFRAAAGRFAGRPAPAPALG